MKVQFVATEKANYPVRTLRQVMEVSPSGFYEYVRRREQGAVEETAKVLVLQVKAIHERTGGCYGRPDVPGAPGQRLRRRAYQARSLMRQAGIAVRRRRRFRVTTDSRHSFPVAPNRLDRQFDVEGSDRAGRAPISPTCGPPRASCTWPWSSICSRGVSSAGPWPNTWASNWWRRPSRWPWGGVRPRLASSTTPIAAASTPCHAYQALLA